MLRKRRAQGRALIVIAGQQVIRHLQGRQQAAQHGIFIGQAEVNQIAAQHYYVRSLRQCIDLCDTTPQALRRVDHTIGFLAVRLDVQIGNLTQDHTHTSSGGRCRIAWAGTSRPIRSPACQVARRPVSTMIGKSLPMSTSKRVRSPMKKVDMMSPDRTGPLLSSGTISTSSGRNIAVARLPEAACRPASGNMPAAVSRWPSRLTPLTRFMVPMKSATKAFAGR